MSLYLKYDETKYETLSCEKPDGEYWDEQPNLMTPIISEGPFYILYLIDGGTTQIFTPMYPQYCMGWETSVDTNEDGIKDYIKAAEGIWSFEIYAKCDFIDYIEGAEISFQFCGREICRMSAAIEGTAIQYGDVVKITCSAQMKKCTFDSVVPVLIVGQQQPTYIGIGGGIASQITLPANSIIDEGINWNAE